MRYLVAVVASLVMLPGTEARANDGKVIQTACGITWTGETIPAAVTPGMLDLTSERTRVLLIAAESNANRSVEDAWKSFLFDGSQEFLQKRLELGIITQPSEEVDWTSGFPPTGNAYNQAKNSEHHYLWRWIGMLAPDFVIVVRQGDESQIRVPGKPRISRAVDALQFIPQLLTQKDSLAWALSTDKPSDVASIPAIEVVTNGDDSRLYGLLKTVTRVRSPAREELQRRQRRSPIQVAQELAKTYGHDLGSVAYIPALALIGRLRIAELTGDQSHQQDVLRIVDPYVSGSKPSLGKRVSGSTLSGHLIFGELARITEDKRFIELARAAADPGFDDQDQPLESMPFHNEMSDAVFMGTPILVQTGRLTGEQRYFDMAMQHLRFMLKLNVREDGLHQHSPLDPAHSAWGRGNGFPALGLALCLTDLPDDSPHRDEMLAAFRAHMNAMQKFQDEMGMWHQIVDRRDSYREFTSTCMTTFAMARGVRLGWLDAKTFGPSIRRAWRSIKCRIGVDGRLVDVCTGTGKQKSLRDYYHRTAILGRDARGGAMALMVSTELAFLEQSRSASDR